MAYDVAPTSALMLDDVCRWLNDAARRLKARAKTAGETPLEFRVFLGGEPAPAYRFGRLLGVGITLEAGQRVSIVLETDRGNMGYTMPPMTQRGGDA